MTFQITVRPEKEQDHIAITRVNDLAFERPSEGKLVENLRKLADFDPRLSLAAEFDGQIIGHMLMFPVKIRNPDTEYIVLSLGPIAVVPEHQKQGVGGQLIKTGHQAALDLGYTSVILLGHPGYYPRFGYQPAVQWGLTNPWNVDGEPWMAVELVPGALAGKAGKVIYPEVFNDVS